MKLSCRMKVDVAIQAGDAKAGVHRLPVVRKVEFLLWKLGDEQPQPIQLCVRDKAAEQTIEIVGVEHLPLRDIAEFWMRRQKNRRGKLGEPAIRQIKIHIEPFQPGELLDLYLRKYLSANGVFRMR